MPSFSNLVGGLAKAAVEQIGNRRQQQGGDGHNQSNYNANNAYSSGSSQAYDPYNPQNGHSNPNAYSGQQGGYSSPDAYSGQQSGYSNQQSNAFGGGYQPNSAGGQIGFNMNTGDSSVPYPTSNYNQPDYRPSSNQYGQSMYPPTNNYPQSNYQPYPGAQPPMHNQPPSQYNSFHHQQPHHQPTMYSNPSIKPDPNFNASHDAEALRKAMKGFGCDKSRVMEVLCARSNMQRQEIARVFKTMYGKDLIGDLKSELHGDFEDLILALMELPVAYDAHQLHKAMARLGTRENVLIEIMTTRTNAQIQQLKLTYRQLYGRDLEEHLVSETSGYFKRLLVSMCAGGRDESGRTDQLRANQDARSLYRAGEQRLGTDEAQFNAILAAQNFAQLRLVFDEYQKHTGHSIEQAVQTEFSGDIRDGLLAIIKSVRNRAAYFAELLNDSMKGLGTRDTDLIRIIVTRSEVDLGDIRNEFHRIFGKSLESAIAGDCSGAYKDGLLRLVKGN